MRVDLVTHLRKTGPRHASNLLADLAVSRATLSRAVAAAGGQVVVRGQARRARYATRRALRGSWASLPLYRVDQQGQLHEAATLDLCHPTGSALAFAEPFAWPLGMAKDSLMRDGWFEGLPYPLHDARPQGFLGRKFARQYAGLLQMADDPQAWSDDDALHAMSLLGWDLPGDLIVGEQAGRRWLDHAQRVRTQPPQSAQGMLSVIGDAELAAAYPQRANEAMADGAPQSSAGGEFPKFLALRDVPGAGLQHVLVKFSGNDGSPGAQRWADLLVCEQLASLVLQDILSIETVQSRIHRHASRTFLEVQRFDRHGALGRSGVVSWGSVNATFYGLAGRPWHEGAQRLQASGWLSAEDAQRIALIWHFGQLIANTDMHDGNLSFQAAATPRGAGLKLAPVYDMLPMLYAPQRGVELPGHAYEPRLPLPAQQAAWQHAAAAALVFWQRAAAEVRVSDAFRRVCEGNAQTLRKLIG